eukprot:COSAG02_NODE_2_length_75708_cov_87.013953_22_plen_71_part_00
MGAEYHAVMSGTMPVCLLGNASMRGTELLHTYLPAIREQTVHSSYRRLSLYSMAIGRWRGEATSLRTNIK